MSIFKQTMDREQYAGGSAFIQLSCSATGDWTDQNGQSVGTTTTSGIVKLKSPGAYQCINLNGDGAGIVTLPPAASMPLAMILILAPTGATNDDISVYDEETGGEISTYGDMDADLDRCIFISNGINWKEIFEVVA